MKGTDFFKELTSTLGVTIPEETLTKLNEVEIPDDIQTKHKEFFISKERAKNDPDIIDHIVKEDRKNHFRIVDKKIEEAFLPLVGADQAQVIKNTFESYKKMDMLATAVSDAIKGAKGKVSEDVRKVEDEWANKVKALEDSHRKQLESQEQKNREMQLNFVIKSKLLQYNFAESFQPLKDSLMDLAIIDLNKKGFLYELENGSVAVRQEKDGMKRDVFEQGTENKLTLEKLLDKFVDPYLAKSSPGKKEDDDASGKPQPQPKPANGVMTLRDRMAAAASA